MADIRTIELSYGETVPVAVTLMRNGVGVSLTGATITLALVWDKESLGLDFGPWQPSAWSPASTVALEDFTCTADGDQSANPGKLTFTPTTAFYTACPPGRYRPQFTVTFGDSSKQRFPRNPQDTQYALLIYPSVADLDG